MRRGPSSPPGEVDWLLDRVADMAVDLAVITPQWGPNMTVAGPVLYDLGDFIDGYRIDPVLRK